MERRKKGTTKLTAGFGDVPLEIKHAPKQSRSSDTVEVILDAATILLEEVGFERLSTNLICEQAGLTPPALYRYFPNKYAVLRELGVRLMAAQDKEVFDWMANGGTQSSTIEEAVSRCREIQQRVNAVSKQQRGAVWITRALRAIPLLQAVRIESRNSVAARAIEEMKRQYPLVEEADLILASKLTTEILYAGTEMVLENPDEDEAKITDYLCRMVALFYATLGNAPGGPLCLTSLAACESSS